MQPEMNTATARDFYESLAKLFYAVAAADKKIRQEETEALKRIVQEEWLKLEESTDEFGADAAYQIEIIFDWLEENRPDPEEAWQEFREYRESHSKLFTKRVKDLTWKTAEAIAGAFRGKNKSELIALYDLKSIL